MIMTQLVVLTAAHNARILHERVYCTSASGRDEAERIATSVHKRIREGSRACHIKPDTYQFALTNEEPIQKRPRIDPAAFVSHGNESR